MRQYQSDFLNTLAERGYIHQCSDVDGLDRLALAGKLIAYVGYDCTAPSLHIGHLISIMMLTWLQQTGGKPIALMGGGTTRVGDPSGKDETRRILPIATIEANKEAIKGVFARFLRFGDGDTAALMLDNAEWLDGLNYLVFLRDIGRHFSVNRMLSFESVKSRLDRDQSHVVTAVSPQQARRRRKHTARPSNVEQLDPRKAAHENARSSHGDDGRRRYRTLRSARV